MNKSIIIKCLAVASLLVSFTIAAEESSEADDTMNDARGYFFGYSFGNMLKEGGNADVNLDELRKKGFSLVPSKYIEFVNRDENVDFDEKMKNLKQEFSKLLKDEENSKKELLKVFEELGHEIKL